MSLRYRIALTIFVLEAVMISVVLWQTIPLSQEVSREQIARTQEVTLNLLGNLSRIALFIDEYDELQQYLEDARRDPSVSRILVANQQGVVVAGFPLEHLGRTLPKSSASTDHYWARKSLGNELGEFGTLAVEFSNRRLLDAQARVERTGWALAIAGMSIIAVIGLIMGHLLTRRLHSLESAAQRFSSGELHVKVPASGRDEVARVGTAFNEMAEVLSTKISELEKSQHSLHLANDELMGVSAELMDIREHLEKMVAARTQEMRLASNELESFCYSVSHDLRSPLRTISGFSDILETEYEQRLDEEGREHLGRIRRAAGRMGELIDDLLSLSRVSRGELTPMQTSVAKLVEEIMADLVAAEPNRQVNVSIQPDMQIWADPRLLRIALENLLHNAWKYTSRQEQARIEISCAPIDGEETLIVSDNGAGFDMSYSDKLFKPFERLHHQEEYEGTGIGLATVQRIVARHHGRIWATGAVGQGASFYLVFPSADDSTLGLARPLRSA